MVKVGADKEKDFKEIIVKYLTDQNRPYSVNDLVANLHNQIPKTGMQKLLDSLTEEGLVKEKLNGKQKAYVISQDKFSVASDADLEKLDNECNVLQNQLTEVSAEIKAKEIKLRSFGSQLTTSEAKKKIAELKDETGRLEVKLESLTNQSNMVDQDAMNKAKQNQNQVVKEWKSRKRMFSDISDAILENYPHPKKDFFEEMSIETDQDVGAVMPDWSY